MRLWLPAASSFSTVLVQFIQIGARDAKDDSSGFRYRVHRFPVRRIGSAEYGFCFFCCLDDRLGNFSIGTFENKRPAAERAPSWQPRYCAQRPRRTSEARTPQTCAC